MKQFVRCDASMCRNRTLCWRTLVSSQRKRLCARKEKCQNLFLQNNSKKWNRELVRIFFRCSILKGCWCEFRVNARGTKTTTTILKNYCFLLAIYQSLNWIVFIALPLFQYACSWVMIFFVWRLQRQQRFGEYIYSDERLHCNIFCSTSHPSGCSASLQRSPATRTWR